jgi:hypothetical protein
LRELDKKEAKRTAKKITTRSESSQLPTRDMQQRLVLCCDVQVHVERPLLRHYAIACYAVRSVERSVVHHE